jgi:hypothetical protein
MRRDEVNGTSAAIVASCSPCLPFHASTEQRRVGGIAGDVDLAAAGRAAAARPRRARPTCTAELERRLVRGATIAPDARFLISPSDGAARRRRRGR